MEKQNKPLSEKVKVWRPIDGKCFIASDVKQAFKRSLERLRKGCCMTPTGYAILNEEFGFEL